MWISTILTEVVAHNFWCAFQALSCTNSVRRTVTSHTPFVARPPWSSLDQWNFGANISSTLRPRNENSKSSLALHRPSNPIFHTNSLILLVSHFKFNTTSPRNTTTTQRMAHGTTSPSQINIIPKFFQATTQLQRQKLSPEPHKRFTSTYPSNTRMLLTQKKPRMKAYVSQGMMNNSRNVIRLGCWMSSDTR